MDWMFIANVAIVIVALAGVYGAWHWLKAVGTKSYKGLSREDMSLRGENQRHVQSVRERIKGQPKPWNHGGSSH